jgi:hypothetical protein
MTLQLHLAVVALKRKPVARDKRAPRAPSIVDEFCWLPELPSVAESGALPVCPLALVAARAPLEGIGEGATSVRVSPPPLQMSQQVWGLLCCGPGTAGQCGSCMADRQIHPLDESGVEPSRVTQPEASQF